MWRESNVAALHRSFTGQKATTVCVEWTITWKCGSFDPFALLMAKWTMVALEVARRKKG